MGKSAINPAVVGKHSTDIAALKNDLGIVEDGDTATHTIAQGQYVIWQGALYTADAAIASGTTLAASGGNKNLTAVENGGLNALNNKITTIKYIDETYKNITVSSTKVISVARPNGLTNRHIINVIAVSWSSSDITTSPTGFALVSDTSPNIYVYFQNAGSLTSITLRYVYID